MSDDERNFWHRYAISRDDQLPDVIRGRGATTAGRVAGFDRQAVWSSATYLADVEPHRHVYVVRSAGDARVRGLLVITTDSRGRVDDFTLGMYEV